MRAMSSTNLTNSFLIAMPNMVDSNFARTLTYVAEHNDQGALGVVVNRPLDMTLAALLERIEVDISVAEVANHPIYLGGPVQTDRGFVLHRPTGDWHSSLRVNDELALTSSRDILQSIASSGEPAEFIVTLGYAGWAAGQLEQEIADNAWLTVQADPSILFSLPPEERLPAAMQSLGVNILTLSENAGHA